MGDQEERYQQRHTRKQTAPREGASTSVENEDHMKTGSEVGPEKQIAKKSMGHAAVMRAASR